MGRLVATICIAFLILGGVWWWRNSHQGNTFDGSVIRHDAAGTSSAAAAGNRQTPAGPPTDAPSIVANGPADAPPTDAAPQSAPLLLDPRNRAEAAGIPPPPPGDSQPPENPEDARFTGSGVYEWYRQGDVTYRLNTQTGDSCIVYATLREWRKPDVYRHSCRTK